MRLILILMQMGDSNYFHLNSHNLYKYFGYLTWKKSHTNPCISDFQKYNLKGSGSPEIEKILGHI